MRDVLRVLGFARPLAGRLVLATLLGVVTAGMGIGLTATSAYLISRASLASTRKCWQWAWPLGHSSASTLWVRTSKSLCR